MTSHRIAAAWQRRIILAGALLTVSAALGLAWTFGWGLRQRPPNVLVVVIDSLRVDRVGAYGSPRRLTPFLDAFAERATVYEQAYAASSWTVPSVASIFTGRYPSEHQTVTLLAPLQESELTLAEVLAAHGYATSAVTANATIRADGGFAQGFEQYEVVGTATPQTPKFDGSLVSEQALKRVDDFGSDRPQFLYLHYMDVHAPYRAHAGITPPRDATLKRGDAALNFAVSAGTWEADVERRRATWGFAADEIWRLEDLYDAEVRHQDTLLRHLFDELGRRGFLDRALIVVTADHGEQFGRHGAYNHGTSLYNSLIHVPLIVRYPNQTAGRRVAAPVELAGLGAMAIRAAGL
ncbi:MAG: sulfatase, partial [Propionibacteriaceae bacterium]|nr:sulfatase [Propionibacteriaceae bacterium]